MKFRLIWLSAFTSLNRNKVRSFLTTLGVIIGVLSVILLTSLGSGLKNLVTEQFEGLGSNLLFVTPGEFISEEGGFSQDAFTQGLTVSKLTLDHVRAIKRIGDPITTAIPISELPIEARVGTIKKNTMIAASTAEYASVRSLGMTSGRFFNSADNETKRRVAVIGPTLAEDLFGLSSAIGQQLSLNGIYFTVIGVVESKGGGGFGGPDLDSIIYIPLETGRTALEITGIQYLLVKIDGEDELARGEALVSRVMGKYLDEDDFSVTDQAELVESIQTILGAITGALAGIAAISLIVGGIGIMNIMLVSVSERTKEIGLRKALGAKPNDILVQFLIEAAALSSFGGLTGIVLGMLISLILDQFIPSHITLSSVALAFSVSWFTGIIFGVFPARKASKLSPIEALRYE
jgi:putative ABC transport system permease protein